jgi:hypothetical protein
MMGMKSTLAPNGGDACLNLGPGSVTHREQKRPVIRRYDALRPGAGDDFGPVGRPCWWRDAATGPGRCEATCQEVIVSQVRVHNFSVSLVTTANAIRKKPSTIVAERRLASLGVCLRWLPLWLPVWLPESAGGESTAESQCRVIGVR